MSSGPGSNAFLAGGPRLVVTLDGPSLAVLSDVHANLPALEAVVADIRRQGTRQVVAAGDLVGYGAWPAACVEYIREAGFPAAAGNYDLGVGGSLQSCGCAYPSERQRQTGLVSLEWTQNAVPPEQRDWLAALPRQLEIRHPDGTVLALVFHGSPRRVDEYLHLDRPESSILRLLGSETAPVAICGHTHVPYVRPLPGPRLLVNSGSAGRPKSGRPMVSYALLHWAHGPSALPDVKIREVHYQHERAAGAVLASGLPADFAQLLLTGREP